MADASKAQKLKLANSRKRFKELQQLRKNKNVAQTDKQISTSLYDSTPIDSLTSSTHSSLNELPQEGVEVTHLNPQPPTVDAAFLEDTHTKKNSSGDTTNLYGTDNNNFIPVYCDLEYSKNKKSSEKSDVDNFNVFEAKVTAHNIFTRNTEVDCDSTVNNPIVNNFQTSKECVDNLSTKDKISNFINQGKVEIWDSNIESLRELSNQMTEVVDSECSTFNSITDLEKRHLELIANLKQERMKSEQQYSIISDLQMKVNLLEKELNEKASYSNTQVLPEVNNLKEELQCHIQTIGMLIAEKTELCANLSQFEICSKQKSEECEELKGRLKTSRSCVADLEREISNLKLENNERKIKTKEQSELVNRLQQECSNLKEQKDELIQDMLEVREKLRNSSEENILLHQQLKELSSKLALANIKIQQLSNEELSDGGFKMAIKEKFELEKQVTELNQTVETIIKERDESSSYYQQYAQQQNAQLMNMSSRLQQLQLENETLSAQEQDRIKHLSELERQLQSLQTDHIKFAVNKSSDIEVTKELYLQLESERNVLEENYRSVIDEKEMLLEELETKNNLISELEDLVEQLRGNQPDSAKLLAMIESDKVAAAKAIQQNKELKKQTESMEEVFLKVNNDKVELTDQLNRERHSNKELLEKLQKTEVLLQTLTDAIEIKDRELFHLQEKLTKLNKKDLQTQDDPSHEVLNELKEAKQINDRTNEINISKDRNEYDLESRIPDFVDDTNRDNNSNESDYLEKEIAMKYLEEKFKRTVQETADLIEEKQRLEHLVLQLQGETETIGEYVALYQQQRTVLNKKCLERDQQLKQLAYDRDQMKMKLERLVELVGKLVFDKGTVSNSLPYVGNEANNVHSKIVDEILTVLSEMKSSNLIHSDEVIHHCSWCSGQLITV